MRRSGGPVDPVALRGYRHVDGAPELWVRRIRHGEPDVTSAERLGCEWRRRAEELGRLAARGGTRAWLARIRLRILRYLLARYGRAPPPRPEGRGEVRRSVFIARTPGSGRGLMPARDIRRLLERIHNAVAGGGSGE